MISPHFIDSIIQVESQAGKGSGFFVDKNLLLTARHVVCSEGIELPSDEIVVRSKSNNKFTAECIAEDLELDVAILRIIDEEHKELNNIKPLKLLAKEVQIGEHWSTFGYPVAKADAGAHIYGDVTLVGISLEENHYEIDLQYNQEQSLDGFSGSPLIIDDNVVGIIVESLDTIQSIGANSISSLKDFLQKNNIEVNAYNVEEAPKHTIINQETLFELKNKVNQLASGYIFLSGKPGSGKTTFIDSLTEAEFSDTYFLKYFVRKKGEENRAVINKTPQNLALWLIERLYVFVHEMLPNKQNISHIDAITQIESLLKESSAKVGLENKKLTIYIDGIDEVNDQSFYEFFPENQPDNIVIIFSGQTKRSLSRVLQTKVNDNEVALTFLSQYECKLWLQGELPKLSYSLQDEVIAQSDHYPLYLHYLISYIKNNFDITDEDQIKSWLVTLPKIDGEIEEYYEYLWQAIESRDDHLYFISLVSRLRESINPETLVLLLPDSYKHQTNALIQELGHILSSSDEIYPYHSSIKQFIDRKTQLSDESYHEKIALFCKNYIENDYSQRNILWHFLLASDPYKEEALVFCNQQWADRCAKDFLEPELILSDLDLTLFYALNNGKVAESIHLLLLKQRMSFRYNDVFALSTSGLVNFLISKNQQANILPYLIRYGVPLVSSRELLYYQSYFYQKNDIQNAEVIGELICAHFLEQLDGAEGFDINSLINYFCAKTIENTFSETPFNNSAKLIDMISRLLIDTEIDSQNVIRLLAYLGGYNKGKILFLKNDYVSSQKTINTFLSAGIPIDIGVFTLAHTYHTCKTDERLEARLVDKALIIDDLNFGLSHYLSQSIDPKSAQILFDLLIGANVKTQYLEKIINSLPIIELASLRQKNGVDVNIEWVTTNFQKGCIEGVKDKNKDISELELIIPLHHSYETSSEEWENYFSRILHYIGKMMGKAWYLETTTDTSEVITDDILHSLFESLKFTLKQRACFDRGYHIPEIILPEIYSKITEVLIDYAPNKIPLFLQFLLDHGQAEQLGIYTEGFRAVIHSVLDILPKDIQNKKLTFQVLKMLEEHVLLGVQNRWERTPELFYIATQYNHLGNSGKSSEVFQELLDTSMGPSWYKEAQLVLIDASLKLIQSEEIEWDITKIAGILDFASGEMTFQRYVRTVKEDFIGHLCKKNKLSTAISYFKNQTIPEDLSLIFERRHRKQIDQLDRGQGYDRGFNYIDSQRAILNILENTCNIDNSSKWMLLELYLLGDPRYLGDFAKLFLQILNNIKDDGNATDIEFFQKRLDYISNELIPEDQRAEFVKFIPNKTIQVNEKSLDLANSNSSSNEKLSLSNEANSKNEMDEDTLYFPGTFGKQSGIRRFEELKQQAVEELDIENSSQAISFFIQALQEKQNAGWGIWDKGNDSDNRKVFNEIIKLSADPSQFIKLLSTLILSEQYETSWGIVYGLIMKFADQEDFLSSELKRELYELLIEHIEVIVNPDKEIYKAYSFLNLVNTDISENHQIVKELILPLLESPDPSMRIRAHSLIRTFASQYPEFYLPLMFQYSVEKSHKYSAEICSVIIVKVAKDNPSSVAQSISLENFHALLDVKHLTIITNYLQILTFLHKQNSDRNNQYIELIEKIYTALFQLEKLSVNIDELLENLSSLPIDYDLSFWHNPFPRLQQLNALNQSDIDITEKKTQLSYGITTKQLNDFERLMLQDSYVYRMLRTPAINEILYNNVNQNNFFPINLALRGE
ncbi:trypsin-like peptidase domain-containing protein [Wohlfahrtiimonas chitiniclastica]|uniref:trypsin-like peptidase domain-containing protein n=1 Tax=Wohlfahrtiimonas chitiniclastica TaxID=400946 RepID=UPI001BCCC402|nr:trypsin-like peptidase domain-containing protein [Wohlfahrtiimonas chitiniclastica]MBS7821458.1 trypsin-like peptidase domain-containing protein [Wohlfahrtiimonas chitiniclastica]